MKQVRPLTFILLGCWALVAGAQNLPPLEPYTPPPAGPGPGPNPPLPDIFTWPATPLDGCSTVLELTAPALNPATGLMESKTHRVIEIAGGLNYLDSSSSTWQPSQDVVELTPDGGAAAVYGQLKVHFSPNLDPQSGTGISITTRSNRVFQTCPVGLYYLDTQSGQSVLLAAALSTVSAVLQPPNVVIYPSVFDSASIKADLRLTYTKLGLECDVILTRKPKSPDTFSLNPATTQLQVRHAWLNAPQPVADSITVGPGLTDQTLHFGDMWFPAGGTAFAADSGVPADTNVAAQLQFPPAVGGPGAVPVGKNWQAPAAGGSVSTLAESATWSSIAPEVAQLPELAMSNSASNKTMLAGQEQRSPAAKTSGLAKAAIRLAGARYRAIGVVLDYTTITGNGDYIFYSGQTYLLTNNAVFNGKVTFQAGTFVKFMPGCSLILDGTIECDGTCANPSYLTSKDDTAYGDQTTGTNCLSYAGAPALWIWYSMSTPVALSNLKIRWARQAIQFDGDATHVGRSLSNANLEFCTNGLVANDCAVTLSGVAAYALTNLTSTASGGSFSGGFTYPGCQKVDLATHITDAMLTLATNKLYNTNGWLPNWDLYTLPTYPFTNFNTSCWVYGIPGFNSLAAGNSDGDGFCYGNPGPYGAGTLITPRHAIAIYHEWCTNLSGRTITFMGRTQQHTLNVLGAYGVTNNGVTLDLVLLLLSSDSQIGWGGGYDVDVAYLAGPEIVDYFTYMNWPNNYTGCALNCFAATVPTIRFNQCRQARARDVWNFSPSNFYEYVDDATVCTNGSCWCPAWCGGTSTPGDSGSPNFFLIQGQLVLHGLSRDTGGGNVFLGSALSNIQAAISAVEQQTGYHTGLSPKTWSLTGFLNWWAQ